MDLALQWTLLYSQEISSVVNTIPTAQGGVHLDAFKKALVEWAQHSCDSFGLLNQSIPLQEQDVCEGLTAALSLQMPNPEFHGQTKDRLNDSGSAKIFTVHSRATAQLFDTITSSKGSVSASSRSYSSRIASAQSGKRFAP